MTSLPLLPKLPLRILFRIYNQLYTSAFPGPDEPKKNT